MQLVETELPAGEVVCVGHDEQASETVPENLPAIHSTQSSPCSIEYLPAAQSMHAAAESAPSVVEYLPAAHIEHTPTPVAEYVPAAQSVHAVAETAPFVGKNLPPPHPKHVLSEIAATASEYLPTAHCTHSCVDWETTEEYVPALQSMQFASNSEAATFEYLPSLHAVHAI